MAAAVLLPTSVPAEPPAVERFVRVCLIHHTEIKETLVCPAGHDVLAWGVSDRLERRIVGVWTAERILLLSAFGELDRDPDAHAPVTLRPKREWGHQDGGYPEYPLHLRRSERSHA